MDLVLILRTVAKLLLFATTMLLLNQLTSRETLFNPLESRCLRLPPEIPGGLRILGAYPVKRPDISCELGEQGENTFAFCFTANTYSSALYRCNLNEVGTL